MTAIESSDPMYRSWMKRPKKSGTTILRSMGRNCLARRAAKAAHAAHFL
jgi:hypothetical protein